ncbi:hypothetical protein IHE44_0010493 [Lamprotornis superbus]|uniref:Uncharacterized protein n=1 Tax=Lamprotornis superbus TaxID=245042 RepID=A0A835TW32_9PASS|nr:hypothetical protein IHE44_0010493 [Lamprotornis superbus]
MVVIRGNSIIMLEALERLPVSTLRNNSLADPLEKLGQRDGQPGSRYSQLEGTSGVNMALLMNSLIPDRVLKILIILKVFQL